MTQDTQASLLDQAREIAAKVAAALDPMKVILFGSAARGEARQDSDIDLLVVMDHAPDPEWFSWLLDEWLRAGKPGEAKD